MSGTSSSFLYVIALAAIGTFVAGLHFWMSDAGAGGIQKRRLSRTGERQAAEETLRRKSTADGASQWVLAILATTPLQALETLVTASGVRLAPQSIALGMAIAAIVFFEIAALGFGWSLAICALVALVLGTAAPLLLLRRLRQRRYGLIARQLPDALDMLVRSLRAGHPVAAGINMIAQEMPAPINHEFALVRDEMAFGLDLRGAFEKMGTRISILEINYMIIAIRIQVGTGGNLAEVLESLSNLMRERQKIRRKIKALSAEARLSGNVLCALPIGVAAVLMFINPHYYDGMNANPVLKTILGSAAALTVMGILLLRRFVNIRI